MIPDPRGQFEGIENASNGATGGSGRELQSRPARATQVIIVGRLVTPHGDCLCRVRNISAGGMMVNTAIVLQPDEPIRLELKSNRTLSGKVVWSSPPRAGVQFDAPIDLDALLTPDGRRSKILREPLPRAPRFGASAVAVVRECGSARPAVLLDVSQGGARVTLPTGLPTGAQVTLLASGLPPVPATVRWCRGEEAGIIFLKPLCFDLLAQWLGDAENRYCR